MKFKESEFRMKLKKIKAEQVISIIAVLVVLTLAVVLTVTAVNNRAKKNSLPSPDLTQDETDTKTPNNGTDVPKESTTPKGNNPKEADQFDTTPTEKEEVPPTLALPVSGNLVKAHSAEVQVFSKTMNEYRTHLGIDIATVENADVRAAADGVVAKVWEDPMMGQCVALTHPGECITVYKNLSKTLAEGVEEGATVRAGQLLGKVGDSAILEIAEEPHLHMEVTVKGLQVDPMDYFSRTVADDLMQDNGYEDPAATTDPEQGTQTPTGK